MSEVDAIMEDYFDTYREVSDALVEIEGDPEYNRLRVVWNGLVEDESRLANQIISLETARDALTGSKRSGVEQQLIDLNQQMEEIQRDKGDVLDDSNGLRRRLGLEARDTP